MHTTVHSFDSFACALSRTKWMTLYVLLMYFCIGFCVDGGLHARYRMRFRGIFVLAAEFVLFTYVVVYVTDMPLHQHRCFFWHPRKRMR